MATRCRSLDRCSKFRIPRQSCRSPCTCIAPHTRQKGHRSRVQIHTEHTLAFCCLTRLQGQTTCPEWAIPFERPLLQGKPRHESHALTCSLADPIENGGHEEPPSMNGSDCPAPTPLVTPGQGSCRSGRFP